MNKQQTPQELCRLSVKILQKIKRKTIKIRDKNQRTQEKNCQLAYYNIRMNQTILYDKSFQQRLEEYKEVLSGYEILPASALAREWSHYLSLTVDPNGWQAIWKIPRLTCKQLKIPFPAIVLVLVLDVQFTELEALVKVLKVQDENCHIPESHNVPIIQLWPTVKQDCSIPLDIYSTARTIDMYRFFYLNLFMPWDNEDDDSSDWLRTHLESRLRLYYDVKNGIIPKHLAEQITSLLMEAKRFEAKRELLESQLLENEIDIDSNPDNENVQTLMEINLSLLKIQNDVEILENPILRNVILRQEKRVQATVGNDTEKPKVHLVYEGPIDDSIVFLQEVKNNLPDTAIHFSPSCAWSLENSNPADVIVLNKSTHAVKNICGLEDGGVLKGIYNRDDTVLTSVVEDVMIDFKGNSMVLQNLTINSNSAHCAILVREGKLVISNCKIIADGKSTTRQGIIVLANAEVEIANSEIVGFSSALVGNSGSKISLEKCDIHDVMFGMKVYENCSLHVNKSSFRNCSDYGICVELETDQNVEGKGDFKCLNKIPSIKAVEVRGINNAKGDVIVNLTHIEPFDDVFNCPEVKSDRMTPEMPVVEDQEMESPCPTS